MNNAEIKYQIFISSTYEDLKEERRGVVETILKYRHFPIGMEMFNANNKEQWEVIKSTIDSSNIYVLIIGNRYGSLTNGKKRISFTEKEFKYAINRRKQGKLYLLCFIIDDRALVQANSIDDNTYKIEQLKRFKDDVKNSKLYCEFWKNTDDLKSKVGSAVSDAVLDINLRNDAKAGWIKRESVPEYSLNNAEIKLLKQIPTVIDILKTLAINFETRNEELQYHDFNEKGHCTIVKERTQYCNCDVSHAMSQYIADKAGNLKILNIINLGSEITSNEFLSIPFVHNNTELRYFIFYGKMIPKGSDIRYRETVHIENFLSNLIDFKKGRIRSKSNPNSWYANKTDVFRFPNTDLFKNLIVTVLQIYPNLTLNKCVEYEIINAKKVFKIDYGMINVGNDIIIQFELN